jgi:hypothetical protein
VTIVTVWRLHSGNTIQGLEDFRDPLATAYSHTRGGLIWFSPRKSEKSWRQVAS